MQNKYIAQCTLTLIGERARRTTIDPRRIPLLRFERYLRGIIPCSTSCVMGRRTSNFTLRARSARTMANIEQLITYYLSAISIAYILCSCPSPAAGGWNLRLPSVATTGGHLLSPVSLHRNYNCPRCAKVGVGALCRAAAALTLRVCLGLRRARNGEFSRCWLGHAPS